MGDIFHQKEDRDIFFNSFANDLGSQLDQLKFEFEEIENGTIPEEPEEITEDATTTPPQVNLENKIQSELEKNLAIGDEIDHSEHHKEHSKFYTMTIQRAFSTVSLMTNFKSNFWKKRHGKHSKHHGDKPDRRHSTASEPETNNNHDIPQIKVNGASEGRATIYSTFCCLQVPRPPKNNVARSKTLSPSRNRPKKEDLPHGGIEQLDRSNSGNVYVPPVIIDGHVVHDFQYSTPESSPVHKAQDFKRRNSLSRLFRRKKSTKKSPNKEKSPKPIKDLYEKTVLTGSNGEIDKCHMNGGAKHNGDAVQMNGEVLVVKGKEDSQADDATIQL